MVVLGLGFVGVWCWPGNRWGSIWALRLNTGFTCSVLLTSSWCFGLAQASRDVRLFSGNVDLAGDRGGVWGLVVLVPGSSLGIGSGLGDHSWLISAALWCWPNDRWGSIWV